MTDFRALCAELVAWAEKTSAHYYSSPGVLIRVRAALAESDGPAVQSREPASVVEKPSDVGPTLDDIWDLCEDHEFHLGIDGANESESAEGLLQIARAVLARWGNYLASPDSSPQPIPVSERLPEAGDCDAEGRCWWGEPQIEDSHDATWNLCTQDEANEFLTWGTKCGWLPAHALPLPGGGVE